jgi:hypothetical protein
VCGFGLGEVRAFFFCSTVALGIGVPCCMLGRIICVRWCCGLMLVFLRMGFWIGEGGGGQLGCSVWERVLVS